MKKLRSLIPIVWFALIITSLTSFTNLHQKSKVKEFSIIFGSGFVNDTVSLQINGIEIIQNIVLKSDEITGIADDVFITYKSNKIQVLGKNLKIIREQSFSYSGELDIIISINKLPYTLRAYLKKGRYIKIDKHNYFYNVNLNQFKKTIKFE